LDDYINNPVALARIRASMTQETLARKMGVTQAYISKLESQARISAKVLQKLKQVLGD
jgi:transcriptional regulator with XRE-family HTH domain